jgi:hypothetical protein
MVCQDLLVRVEVFTVAAVPVYLAENDIGKQRVVEQTIRLAFPVQAMPLSKTYSAVSTSAPVAAAAFAFFEFAMIPKNLAQATDTRAEGRTKEGRGQAQ